MYATFFSKNVYFLATFARLYTFFEFRKAP